MDRELLNEDDDYDEDRLWCLRCKDRTVAHKHYPSHHSAWGWDPPDDVYTCSNCGEVDEFSEDEPEDDET